MATQTYTYPPYAKILHLGMATFGILAFLTAEGAEDGSASIGYLLHAYLGLSLAAFVLLRVGLGFAGRQQMRFSSWSPLLRRQWALALEDVRDLLRLRVPERGMHEGLAGLTQAFGLAVFAWMGATGTGMYLLAGGRMHDLFEVVEEIHEVGEALIPMYLALHVGSVIAHSLAGQPIWQRMWRFSANPEPRASHSDEGGFGKLT